MSERESIFRVRLLPDGSLECEDWQGNTHRCTEANLGTTIRRVLASPELPPVERVSAGGYNMAEAYAKMLLPEQYQGLVRPAANAVMQALQHLMATSNAGRQARADAWQQQQRPPHPPEPPPRHPPRSANRRGRYVA